MLLAAATAAGSANSSLIEAVKQQDRATVRALLQQNVDVNAADGDGSTALHWAAANGDLELTQALLKAGASVKPVTRIGGMSPLFMAARNGSDGVVDALLAAGAGAGEANGNGTTVLMMAAASGNAATVRLLIDRGADVNAMDVTNGQTALMFAAARNAPAAIQVLLAAKGRRRTSRPRCSSSSVRASTRTAIRCRRSRRVSRPPAPRRDAAAAAVSECRERR